MTIVRTVSGPTLADDFNRANSDTPGGDWVEVTSDWDIVSNTLRTGPNSQGSLIKNTAATMDGGFVQALASGSLGTGHNPGLMLRLHNTADGYEFRLFNLGSQLDIRRWSGGVATVLGAQVNAFVIPGAGAMQFYVADNVQWGRFYTGDTWITVSRTDATFNAQSGVMALRSATGSGSVTKIRDDVLWMPNPFFRVTLTDPGAHAGWKAKVYNSAGTLICQATESGDIALPDARDSNSLVPLAGWSRIDITNSSDVVLDQFFGPIWPGEEYEWDGAIPAAAPTLTVEPLDDGATMAVTEPLMDPGDFVTQVQWLITLPSDPTFAAPVVDETTVGEDLSFRTEGTLDPATDYIAKAIVSTDADGELDDTNVVEFTTADFTKGTTPTVSLVTPKSDTHVEVGISAFAHPDGQVDKEDFDPENPESYGDVIELEVRLSSDPDWTTPLETVQIPYSTEAALRRFAFHDLIASTSYKFRGRILDGHLGVWTLHSADLTESTEAAPANAPLQPTLDLVCGREIEWTGGAFAHATTGTHTASEIQICLGSSCRTILYSGAVTSGTIEGLAPGDYDLKLRYRDDLNRWGPRSTVEECEVPETLPVPVFTDPAIGSVVSGGFTLEWEIYDPESVGYLSDVELSTDGVSFTVVANGQAGQTSAFSATGRNNGDYIYRVRVQDPDTGDHGEYAYFPFTLDRTGARSVSYHFADFDALPDTWRQIHSGPSFVNWGLLDNEDPFTETVRRVGLFAQRLQAGTSTRRSGLVMDEFGEPDEFDLTVTFEHIPNECVWPPQRFSNAFVTRGGALIFGVEGATGAERSGRYTLMDWGIQPWNWGAAAACVSDAGQASGAVESARYANASGNTTKAITYGRSYRQSVVRATAYRRLSASIESASTTLPSSTSPRIGGAYVYTDEYLVLGNQRSLYTMRKQVRRGVSGGAKGWFIKTQILGPGIGYQEWHREEFVRETISGGFRLPCGACGLGFEDMDSIGVGRSQGILFTDFSIRVLSYGECVAPLEVGCEADWDFTIFEDDGVTPWYGTADAEGNVLEADFYDRVTCPRPYLLPPRDFSETTIDYPAGASDIGQITVSVLDKRLTGSDQSTGIVTARVSEAKGRRAVLRRWREDLGMVTVFDGVIHQVENDSGTIVTYHFRLRDPRERERDVELFTRNETFALWPEDGPIASYGFLGLDAGYLLTPAQPADALEFTEGDASGPDIFYGYVTLASGFGEEAEYIERVLSPLGLPTYNSDTGLYEHSDITIRWRPAAGGSWTYLRDMPSLAMRNAIEAPASVFPFSSFVWRLYMASTTAADLPGDLDLVDIQILAAKTTETTPFFWDLGTFGTLLLQIYRGDYTKNPPNIRFNEDELTAWALQTPNARFVMREPAKDLREWVQENIYAPLGYAPSFDADMRIVPSAWELPPADEDVIELDPDWIIPVGEFSDSAENVINRVTYTYIREYVLPPDVSGGIGTVLKIAVQHDALREIYGDSAWTRLVEQPIPREYVYPPSMFMGENKIEYKPTTVRSTGGLGEALLPLLGIDTADRIADRVGINVLARFRWGAPEYLAAVRSGMAHGPTFDPFTLDLRVGQWVKVRAPWLPQYATGKRELYRYMQIASITDPEIHYRRLRLIDGGPVLFLTGESEDVEDLLDPPTIGTLTETSDLRVEVPITLPAGAPGGYTVRVEYAVNATEPASTSGLWTLAGYTTVDADVLIPILPAGSVVWVRARGEVFGRRPSAWADAETITLSQTPGLTIVELTLVENESAGCTPHLSWTPNAYAEGLRIRTSVGAFGHTPSYSLWDDVDSDTPLEITLTEIALDPGEEIYVEVTAYPTFSMGSVSGSPGSQYVLRESCEVEEDEGGGVTEFLALNDTPDSYSGEALRGVRVNSDEDGLEFFDVPQGIVDIEFVNVTAGDVAVTATTAATPTTLYDGITVSASTGDVLAIIAGYSSGSDTEAIRVNGVTLDNSNAQVNFVGPGTLGVRAWGSAANEPTDVGGTQLYTVQSGDIRTGGVVKVRLIAWLSSAGSRTISASSSVPIHFAVINYGQ